ncbi:MAG TPA: hypothetical protein VGA29_00750 [Ignavibacteriaceae bacterium]
MIEKNIEQEKISPGGLKVYEIDLVAFLSEDIEKISEIDKELERSNTVGEPSAVMAQFYPNNHFQRAYDVKTKCVVLTNKETQMINETLKKIIKGRLG